LNNPDQLKAGQPDGRGKLAEAKLLRAAGLHDIDDPGNDRAIARRGLDAAAAAAVAPEQLAEDADQQLVQVKSVVPCFESAVQPCESRQSARHRRACSA